LLEPIDIKIRQAAKEDESVLLDILEDDIRWAAEVGHPFAKSGANGVHEQRFDLNPVLQDLSRAKLWSHIDMLKRQKRVVSVAPKGSKFKSYFDVPGGPFVDGNVEVQNGKRPSREESV